MKFYRYLICLILQMTLAMSFISKIAKTSDDFTNKTSARNSSFMSSKFSPMDFTNSFPKINNSNKIKEIVNKINFNL